MINDFHKKSYFLYFSFLSNKVMEWVSDSNNKDLKNVLKATQEIGLHVSALHRENEMLKKQVSLEKSLRLRAEKDLSEFKEVKYI